MSLALISLFLAAFSIGTTEFVIAGLLPEISRDLGVPVPNAGLLVSGYAIGVAIGGPILTLLTARFPRKPTILFLMAIFVAGHVFGAFAQNYALLLTARLIISLSHGSFFGLAAIIAVSLVPETRRNSALALVFAGISVANIVGVPLGTAIGNAFGWRATFWAVGGLAIVAVVAMAFVLPRDAGHQDNRPTIAAQFRVLGHPKVYTTYLIIVLMMIGFFGFFTYVAPFLTEVSGVPGALVPWLLLLFGVGATTGIFTGGRFGDWRPRETLLFAFPAQVAVYAAIVLLSGSGYAMAVLLFALGAATIVTNSTIQNRILTGAAEAPDLASTLISSVYNIGIAAGAWIGATALTGQVPYAQLPMLGLVTSTLAGLMALIAYRMDGVPVARVAG